MFDQIEVCSECVEINFGPGGTLTGDVGMIKTLGSGHRKLICLKPVPLVNYNRIKADSAQSRALVSSL